MSEFTQLEKKIEAMSNELEKKAGWKELFYPNSQSRGKFAASPWTENIYPSLRIQLDNVLSEIRKIEPIKCPECGYDNQHGIRHLKGGYGCHKCGHAWKEKIEGEKPRHESFYKRQREKQKIEGAKA